MHQQKKKIAIGFDLGTTSVGWSVVEVNKNEKTENLNILNMGVRLFDDPANNESNIETRRIARGRRRRIHRQKIRKQDFFKLLRKYNLVKSEEEYLEFLTKSVYDENDEVFKLPVEIKMKGLKEKLSKHELVSVLHNYLKHRGSLNTIDLTESEEKEKSKKKEKWKYDSSKFPCENQYRWFLTTGKIIGNEGNYLINNKDFEKEIRKILVNQNDLGINESFTNEFINLFQRHRKYWEGPGSENSPTIYGRFEKLLDNGKVKIGKWLGGNLWDLSIGKCTYYPNENRNYKESPISEVFNLLNDLGNLKIKENNDSEVRYLTLEEKIKLLSLPYEKLTLSRMLKEINLSEINIVEGLKKVKNNKVDKKTNKSGLTNESSKIEWKIEELNSTKKILEWLSKNNFKKTVTLNNLDHLEYIHRIYEVGVKKQNFEDRFNDFKEKAKELGINSCDCSSLNELAKLKIYSSGTSKLSKRAQLEFIKFATTIKKSEGKNQANFFIEEIENKMSLNNFDKYKYFPKNYFANEIMPMTVKRTFNQAIKVLNQILHDYCYKQGYELTHIIIELARELNSVEEKQKIEDELKKNKEKLEKLIKSYNINKEQLEKGGNRIKFLLWVQQNKQDLYDGEPIDLHELLSCPNKYHIDHVIPVSMCFVDSLNNKVLTKAENNCDKDNSTPFYWLSKKGKYEEYKNRCIKLLDSISDENEKSKFKNKLDKFLLYEKDPSSELFGFVGRQLNDTRYVSREISNQLKNFFKQSNNWKEQRVVIRPIYGSITSFARKKLFSESDCQNKLLIKNRDEYSHHAIDASIIAYLGLNYSIEKLLEAQYKNLKSKKIDGKISYYDIETGETIITVTDFLYKTNHSKYFRDQMRKFLDDTDKKHFVKFSRMLVSKSNIKISDETIYKLRSFKNDGNYKILKLSVLDSDIETLKQYFGKDAKQKEKVLMYLYDNKMYEKLNNVFKKYEDSVNAKLKNPFISYLKDNTDTSEILEWKKAVKEEKDVEVDINLLDKIPIFKIENGKFKVTHWIKTLKIKKEEKNINDILKIRKQHNKNEKSCYSDAFYDSLNPIEVRVYKTKNNKYQTVFINALYMKWNKNIKKWVADEDKIKDIYIEKINFDYKPIILKKGTALINNNKLYYFNGGGVRSKNQIQIKATFCEDWLARRYLNLNKKRQREKESRIRMAISNVVKKFKICKTDVLGNIYDVKSFDECFKK